MNRLGDLITELCPDGVEWKKLGEVIRISKGVQFNKSDMQNEGSFPVINGGINPSGYIEKYNQAEDTITISQGGASAGYVNWLSTKFWAGAHCYVVKPLDNVINRYVFHFLKSKEKKLQECQYGAGIPALSKATVENLLIPVPPLEVQREIVRILDAFTELTAKLTAELTAELVARKQQYEYYRDLLMFDVGSSVEFKRLGEVATYGKERIDASNVDFNSYVGVDNLLPDKQGKTISSYVPNEGRLVRFMAGDILIGNIRPYLKKIWFAEYEGGTNGDVLVIRVTADSLSPKFLYYGLSSDKFFHYAVQFSKGAKMPRGDKSATMDFLIPVPSLEEQERIVKILDRFDRLCNDLSEGLPAEIEARKQQYEFYRDKLLSFDKDWR